MSANTKFEIRMQADKPSRLAADLPITFVSTSFDQRFIALAAHCIETILRQAAAKGEPAWRHKSSMLARLGLTELRIARVRDIGPVEVIATSADGEVSSRFVDVEPLPSGFDRLLFRLERNVIQRHEDFREICAILAYMLCLRLFSKRDQDSSAAHHLALLNLSPPVLSEYADRHHRGELGVGSLVRFIILKSIEGDIDALPVWQGFDRL